MALALFGGRARGQSGERCVVWAGCNRNRRSSTRHPPERQHKSLSSITASRAHLRLCPRRPPRPLPLSPSSLSPRPGTCPRPPPSPPSSPSLPCPALLLSPPPRPIAFLACALLPRKLPQSAPRPRPCCVLAGPSPHKTGLRQHPIPVCPSLPALVSVLSAVSPPPPGAASSPSRSLSNFPPPSVSRQ